MTKCLLKAVGRAAALGAILVLGLLLGGCKQPTNDDDGSAPSVQGETAAAEFRALWDLVLEKKPERVTLSDEADVDDALEAWEALDTGVQAELTVEKEKLDSLKASVNSLKTSLAAWRVYLAGKPDNTVYNPYVLVYTGRESPARIYQVIESAGKYVILDLSKSGVTGFEHDTDAGRKLVVHLVLPDTLEEIENPSSFRGFLNLKTISAPGLVRVSDYAFQNSGSLTAVNLPESVESVGAYAFQNCTNLTAINLPQAVSVGNYAFNGCTGLTTVNLPQAESLGTNAFSRCTSLTAIDLPQAVTLQTMIFAWCTSLDSVNLPKAGVIPAQVFYLCTSLSSVSLPEAATFGIQVFTGCTSLGSINIPKAADFGLELFRGCTSLTTVTLGGTPPTFSGGGTIFTLAATEAKTITFKVPNVSVYTAAGTPWSDKVNMTNATAGNYWDNTAATRDNLTVALAAIDG